MQFPFIFSLLLSCPLFFFFLIFLGSFKRILCESESVSYSIGSEVWGSMDCTPSGFSVHGILQARVLEWVAIPFSKGSCWPRDQTQVSGIARRFFTIWATGKSLYKFRDWEIKTEIHKDKNRRKQKYFFWKMESRWDWISSPS